jgi:hypothetical protein
VYRRKHDVLNVLCILGGADALRATDLAAADEVWHVPGALPKALRKAARQDLALNLKRNAALPDLARHLRKLVDTKIGRSFHTS